MMFFRDEQSWVFQGQRETEERIAQSRTQHWFVKNVYMMMMMMMMMMVMMMMIMMMMMMMMMMMLMMMMGLTHIIRRGMFV